MRGEEEGDSLGILKRRFFARDLQMDTIFALRVSWCFCRVPWCKRMASSVGSGDVARVGLFVRFALNRVCSVSRHPAPPFLHVSRVPCVSRLPPVLFEQLHCELVPSQLRMFRKLG